VELLRRKGKLPRDDDGDNRLVAFASNLRDHVNRTIRLLDEEPKLAHDFQVIIDPKGTVWHFDLDRALGHNVRGTFDEGRMAEKLKDRVASAKRELRRWGVATAGHAVAATKRGRVAT
jgi:hypothetical protein